MIDKNNKLSNIAIITARSGSKGLKDKNIKKLNGRPLLVYSIEAALQSGVFDTVMVSTDSEKYAMIAKEYGAEVPFLRSGSNSGDTAGSWDVVLEVLGKYKELGKEYDTVCLLQPTSPLRTAEDIISAYSFATEKGADAISSVCPCEHPVQYMMTLDEDKSLSRFREEISSVPRQMLPSYYRLNGAIYIKRITYKGDEIILEYDKEYAFIMSKEKSVDIDTEYDFKYAEFIMEMENSK